VVVSLKPDTIRSGFRDWFVGEENAEGEQRAYCPVCEDPDVSSSPSAMMNPDGDIWNCLKGNHGGSITSLSKQLKTERGWDIRGAANAATRRTAPVHSPKQTNKSKGPAPSPTAVIEWNQALLENKGVISSFMSRRGIDEESIIENEIGWDEKTRRFTIPVYDKDGELVNIRKYKMGAGDNEQKFINHQGWGNARLFMPWVLEDAEGIILAEGELDCLLLNQMGFPAVSGTGGSGTWLTAWSKEFTGKTVYVAYDQDDAGEKGALLVSNALRNFATAVYRVKLPTPGSDVTDFFMKEDFTEEDFEKVLEAASAAGNRVSTAIEDMPTIGTRASLLESMSEGSTGEPLELIVSVTGKMQEPWTAPRRVVGTCDMSKGVACETCPLQSRNGSMEILTQAHDTRLISFVDISATTQHKLLRSLMGARCSDRIQFDIEEIWNIEELTVQNSIDERTDDVIATPTHRTVWSIGTYRTQTNEKIRLLGQNVQDPKSGGLKFTSWINQKVELDIDKFKLDSESRDRLTQFQPEEGQSYLDKCLDIAKDMSANVTGIIGRELLHVGMDLVWHSPIAFRVRDKDVDKGWLEMMVVGDTRTGKSEIATSLMKHYLSGRLVSCEGVTFAGLIGGVQQINGRWNMTWGAVPMNDRRLVVLDEVSGMAENNIIEQMSQVRSSGIAQVTKIASESTSARVRLIWISNPVGGKFLSENRLGGIGALITVVPNMEDIARFDFVMASAKGDVGSADINADHRQGTPSYSSDDCELLVKWSWSLGRDNVKIGDRAVTAASQHAIKMGERYTSSPPLVQAENVRFKILRIAAAMAARTFSIGKTGPVTLQVSKAHVEDAVRFLDAIYGEDSLGYGRMSRAEIERTSNSETNLSLTRQLLKQHPGVFETLFMNIGGEFRVRDFEEFQGIEKTTASNISASLHKWGLTKYAGRGVFSMTEQLVKLLDELKEEGI